jgi:Pyruvate/2-oxoacid:ferredoxin oxidoreductase gamma subunit
MPAADTPAADIAAAVGTGLRRLVNMALVGVVAAVARTNIDV